MKPTPARILSLAKRRRLRGLTTVEYAVAGALMAAGIVVAFTNLGGSVAGRITELAAAVGGEGDSGGNADGGSGSDPGQPNPPAGNQNPGPPNPPPGNPNPGPPNPPPGNPSPGPRR